MIYQNAIVDDNLYAEKRLSRGELLQYSLFESP